MSNINPLPSAALAPEATTSATTTTAAVAEENATVKQICKYGMRCQFLRPDIESHPFTPDHMKKFSHQPMPEPEAPPPAVVPFTPYTAYTPPVVNDSDVAALVSMGFPRAVAIAGLQNCGGDVELAADMLFSSNQNFPMEIDEKVGPQRQALYEERKQECGWPGVGATTSSKGTHAASSSQLPSAVPSELHLRRNLSMRASSRAESLRTMVADYFSHEDYLPESFVQASFVLPDLDMFTDDFAAFVRRDLIYSHAQTEMEHLKIINWCGGPKLFPLNTNGKGNCLVDACSLSLWGIQDSTMNLLLLRRELHGLLLNNKALFASRYGGKDLDRLIEEANPEQTQGKGATLEKLEQLHILGLAHLLGRPIIVYAEAKYRDFQDRIVGDCEGESRMDGIYLPLEPSALFSPLEKEQNTRPAPVCLAFRKFHFSAAVPCASWELLNLSWDKLPKATAHRKKEQQQQQTQQEKEEKESKVDSGREEKTPSLWYPLVDHEGKELFVHFLKEGENKQALMERWFTLVNVNGVQGAKMPSENLSFNSELLHEYLESTAENVSALPPEALSDALGKNKPCANRCGRKGILSGLCDDCEFLPEMVKLVNCPTGQGCTRGVYKTTSYDAKGRPIYKKVHGHAFYLFNYYNQQQKAYAWIVSLSLLDPTNVRNMEINSTMFNVTRLPGTWRYYKGGDNPWGDAKDFKIIPYEVPPKPKPDFCPDVTCSNILPCATHSVAPVLARCKNSDTKPGHDFMGSSATDGLCSSCHGEATYGEMIVSGAAGIQADVNGVYRFYGMRTDDEGEQRPAFICTQSPKPSYLYFLEGEWSIGEVAHGPARRILVAATELPHEVKNIWMSWTNGGWQETPSFKVTQKLVR